MPHEVIEQLHSMGIVLDHFAPSEKQHYEDQDKPEGHIYEAIVGAQDGFTALSQLLEAEVRAYGGEPITVADILFTLDNEEQLEHFQHLAEDLAMEGRLRDASKATSTDG